MRKIYIYPDEVENTDPPVDIILRDTLEECERVAEARGYDNEKYHWSYVNLYNNSELKPEYVDVWEYHHRKIKERHQCSLGEKSGWCDGKKKGSRFKCPNRLPCGDGTAGCELKL